MTRKEILTSGIQQLKDAGFEECISDARLLFESVTGVTLNEYYMHPEISVEPDRADAFQKAIETRLTHKPVQYITGETGFMGLTFVVNKNVLIPRPDTECLVEEAMRLGLSGMRILDMCTGSGCILLSLLHYGFDCVGTGVDISSSALAVASENATRLGIEAEWICGDLFTAVPEAERYDLIVSNPPYIRSDVIPTLMEEVRDHEPMTALDGEADGLAFYRRITDKAPEYLLMGGSLMYEIGYDQGEAVSALMKERGFEEVEVVKDLSGNDRVVRGTWSRRTV